MSDKKSMEFADWLGKLIKQCLPIETQIKILARKPLTNQELEKFKDVIILAAHAKGLRDHADMASKLDNISVFVTSCDATTKALLQKQDAAQESLDSLHEKADDLAKQRRGNCKSGKKHFTYAELESINNKWLTICNSQAFKTSLNTKGSHADAFNWDRNGFIALRVESAEELDKILHMYSQRKSRRAAVHLQRRKAKK